jgi:hypothetical protein
VVFFVDYPLPRVNLRHGQTYHITVQVGNTLSHALEPPGNTLDHLPEEDSYPSAPAHSLRCAVLR